MHPTSTPLDEEFARAALREALIRSGLSSAGVAAAIAEFDSAAVSAVVSDANLRAALLILRRDERWDSIVASIMSRR